VSEEAWQEGNEVYLEAALVWLRLRLEQMIKPPSSNELPEKSVASETFATEIPASSQVIEKPPDSPAAEKKGLLQRIFNNISENESALPPSGPKVSTETASLTSSASDVKSQKSQSEESESKEYLSKDSTSRPSLLPPSRASEDLVLAAAKMKDAEAMQPPPALVILRERFGLSSFEQNVLLLSAAMDYDTRIASLCARVQDDPRRPYPTFALAMVLFDDPAWDILSPDRPLRYWQMIEISQQDSQPLTACPIKADDKIVSFIKGLNYLDDRLTPFLMPLESGRGQEVLPPSQKAGVDATLSKLRAAPEDGRLPVMQLIGNDPLSKQLVAEHISSFLRYRMYRLPAELLPSQISELDTLARLWQRESMLLPLALYLDAQEVERPAGAEGPAPVIERFLAKLNCISFLGTHEVWPLRSESIIQEVFKPEAAEQRDAWASALGAEAGDSPKLLAGQFNLNLSTLRQIAHSVLQDRSETGISLNDRLWMACLASTRPRLDVLALRIDAKAIWDDIVLPPVETDLLHQIANQVRQRSKVYDEWGFRRRMNRGLGISALFAGESGTGKTMAAEVIANDLNLSLYKIDLSTVVSKYIGETEKNLRRLFDAAEDGGAILFFDEADALFGKRSEVRDSHDRYANIEINYLLQRIESYRGLAILATNMKSSLDPAFVRRLRFIVNFAFPGLEERRRIWKKAFPKETPAENLDFDRLAKLSITGGSIHSIALSSAFLAASSGQNVTMPLVLTAARSEFRKLDKTVNEADLAWNGGGR
jgi:hypothetical protein